MYAAQVKKINLTSKLPVRVRGNKDMREKPKKFLVVDQDCVLFIFECTKLKVLCIQNDKIFILNKSKYFVHFWMYNKYVPLKKNT